MTNTAVGLVLAAGEGSRLGRPKALIVDSRGSWLHSAVSALRDGGVSDVYVVVGAAKNLVVAAVPAGCHVVDAVDWRSGMGASLRAGLSAIAAEAIERDAVIVMLVDTPGVGPAVVRRLAADAGPATLARAAYGSKPGHPVLIGRDHWTGVLDVAGGDRGARDYLHGRDVALVECADIGSGSDVDTPQSLASWQASND